MDINPNHLDELAGFAISQRYGYSFGFCAIGDNGGRVVSTQGPRMQDGSFDIYNLNSKYMYILEYKYSIIYIHA